MINSDNIQKFTNGKNHKWDNNNNNDLLSTKKQTKNIKFKVLVQWKPNSVSSINPTRTTLEPIRSFMDANKHEISRKSRRTSNIQSTMNNYQAKAIRLTWGPRLNEPIKYELYTKEIQPLINPEKTQSKVLDVVSWFLLKIQ